MYASWAKWLTILSLHLLVVASSPAVPPEAAQTSAEKMSNVQFVVAMLSGASYGNHFLSRQSHQVLADHSIKPFNEDRDLPGRPEGQLFKPIGHVKPLSIRLAKPTMFKACFVLNSRTARQPDICLRLSKTERFRFREGKFRLGLDKFQFDLRKLNPSVSEFRADKRTVVIIPGYLTSSSISWQEDMSDYWLKLEDVNVIQVHWPAGNNRLVYESAAANVPVLARQITILLYYLASLNGREFTSEEFRSSIHLVGHSLGAHVAGFVGKELGGQAGRITALDPAGPIFDLLPEHERLQRSDAKFVDVLHTNAGRMNYMRMGVALLKKALAAFPAIVSSSDHIETPLRSRERAYENEKLTRARRVSKTNYTAWFGFEQPLGHIDYYANGGSIQPGCLDDLHVCDHGRATSIYLAALKYEYIMRNHYGKSSEVVQAKTHRLFAFRPREYQVFRSGGRLHQECAHYFLASSFGDVQERLEAHKRCTVPIDYVSTGRDLRKELSEEYAIDLEDANPERRYYFETLDGYPFVTNQMLMKIHTKVTPTNAQTWSDKCRLASIVRPPDGQLAFAQVDHRPDFSDPIDQDGFHGHLVPFADTNNWCSGALDSIQLKILEDSSRSSAQLRRQLQAFLPPHLIIKLGYEDGRSGSIKWSGSGDGIAKCLLTITEIELRQLGTADVSANLTLLYTVGQVHPGETVVERDQLVLTDHKEPAQPIELSTSDSVQYFFLSHIGIGDQPSA